MNGRIPVVLGLVAALGASGCSRFGGFGSEPQLEPLPAVPAAPVAAAALPPPTNPPPPVEPVEPEPIQPAALPAPEQQLAVQRSELLGGWTIESGGERCQLFMVLTGWSGGYRASTRGCQSEALKGVSAWDLAGKEITLKDSATAPVANLYATAPGKFNGRLSSGEAVSVFR